MLDFFRRVDEFDVIRAFAVTGVVVNHVWGLSGGFIGVDIFFVISGYVITLMLLDHSVNGTFSFRDFYYRRVVRIIPPLFLVSAAIYFFSWFLFYLQEESIFIRESFLFQSFFAQNFYFTARAADYFQGLTNAKLNLHTWSLAVEEQFYLIYPVFFILLYRYRYVRWMVWVLVIFFAISLTFLTSAYEYHFVPSLGRLLNVDFSGYAIQGARYYLVFTRLWQLLLGAFACLLVYQLHSSEGTLRQIRISSMLARVIAAAAVGVLALSFVFIEETMAWPRMIALLPMVTTAGLLGLLHLYGASCLPSILNSRPLHNLGRSSYSLYLWHWPILCLLIYANSDFGVWWFDYVIYFVVVAFLTTGTYLFIEQRRHFLRPGHAWIILLSFSGLSLIAAKLERSPEAFPVEIQTIFETGTYSAACTLCKDVPTQHFFVLWGDSHSQMMAQAAAQAAADSGFQLVHIKGSLADSRRQLIELTGSPLFVGVVMASRWSMYAVGFPADEPEEIGNRYLRLDGKVANDSATAGEHFRTLLRRFITDTNGSPILLMLEVPRYSFFPKKELTMNWAGLKLRPLSTKTFAEHLSDQKETREMIQTITAEYSSIQLADPAEILCADGTCVWHKGWELYYKDDDHLSVNGAERLSPIFKEYFKNAGASKRPESMY